MPNNMKSNFSHLSSHSDQLLKLGLLAERYFSDDPNTCLLKLRQLAELLAQETAANLGMLTTSEESQFDLIRRLQDRNAITREVAQLFHEIRRTGNDANHALKDDFRSALSSLKLAWQLSLWFHRTFNDPSYRSGPFVPPKPPTNDTDDLRSDLNELQQQLEAYVSNNKQTAEQLSTVAAELAAAKDEKTFWEQMALETESNHAELKKRLEELQTIGSERSKEAVKSLFLASRTAANVIHLDEAETRKLIDEQLRQAGWEVDSANLRFAKGTRPQKGKNLAIAEWPTESGPADYVLFIGLTPVATVEAKRKNKDVSASLQQAKRYSRGFKPSSETVMHPLNFGADNEYRIPFTFSTNGRPFIRQVQTFSGIWFCDVRESTNLGHALDGWYTPEGLSNLLKRDAVTAHEQLKDEPFNYGFTLRKYQQNAIREVETKIAEGQREMLLAMATGTGKTKTCIALIYRLLKAQRFRRILFLVDRSALGEQAANAFKDTRMESLQTFADVFGIKEIDEQRADTDTLVHIATIQGLVQRVLYYPENSRPPQVDEYDCIIVDECHRGYLLDREMSDTEMQFRSYDDYISKYRRILDYFDAFKIGLTATPALHTTEIFGEPIFTYGYREAVIDGHLIDHGPPIQIKTKLSSEGIVWKVGEEATLYDQQQNKINLVRVPDEVKIEIEEFNRKVITRPFNTTVCEYLAQELDPNSRQKTLVFCVTDNHADIVVDELKNAFKNQYGSIDDDAVVKITGAADKPLELIRKFKNERHPNVAVTVDLLTTGIDVPEICNIVFIRRVSSRILFDQMMGRATRLCEEIGKEAFRIFDAVRIYEALQNLTEMKPVVVDPKITFTQMEQELRSVTTEEQKALVRDQFAAKLQRKKRHLPESAVADFETLTGMEINEFVEMIREMQTDDATNWFKRHPGIGEILDRKSDRAPDPIYISEHPDEFLSAERGYGQAVKPKDYIEEFARFIKSHQDEIPALLTVMTRPRELTRKQLRELALELDRAGFSEQNLATAWREMTNQDIAARIVGYIRQAAVGDTLLPYEQRVENALQKMLASRNWTTPQRQWLQKISAQTKANVIVDRDAIDDPDLIFTREGGGFVRLDKLFNGELQSILELFNESIWQAA